MNRFKVLVSIVMAVSVLAACSSGTPAPEGTAFEIAERIFAAAKVEPFGAIQSLATDAEKEFYLGSTDYPAFAEAVAVLPMISIDTRVLVVIKAADKSTVKDIEARLEENIDPTRLVCVTFSLEDVAIESRGEVILLTINTDAEQRAALVEAFRTIE
jgi:hypothetical protein